MAPFRLWLLCVLWVLDQQLEGRRDKSCYMYSWRTGCLAACAAQEPQLWSMHYGTIHFSSTAREHTHTQAHFLGRKFKLCTTTKDTALPCLRSEVKRVLFRHKWVCVCARVAPTLAQTADVLDAGPVVLAEARFKISN